MKNGLDVRTQRYLIAYITHQMTGKDVAIFVSRKSELFLFFYQCSHRWGLFFYGTRYTLEWHHSGVHNVLCNYYKKCFI